LILLDPKFWNLHSKSICEAKKTCFSKWIWLKLLRHFVSKTSIHEFQIRNLSPNFRKHENFLLIYWKSSIFSIFPLLAFNFKCFGNRTLRFINFQIKAKRYFHSLSNFHDPSFEFSDPQDDQCEGICELNQFFVDKIIRWMQIWRALCRSAKFQRFQLYQRVFRELLTLSSHFERA